MRGLETAGQIAADAAFADAMERGCPVGAGWAFFKVSSVPSDTPEAQVLEIRRAYLEGAVRMFNLLYDFLDPSIKPGPEHETLAQLVASEIDIIMQELAAFTPAKGENSNVGF